jgi:uncharacterized membrane protein
MRAALIGPAAALLLLAACKPAGDTAAPAAAAPAPAATVATAAPAAPAVAAPEPVAGTRLRGTGIMGKDGYGITLCGEDQQRIAMLEPQAQGMLDGFLSGGAHEFAVDGWGDLVGMDKVHVTTLERIGPAVEGGGCDERGGGAAFRAHGNEPFWSLDVTGGELVLARPDQPELRGKATELTETHGIRSYSATTPAGLLTVRLSPATCNDGMADGMFAWRAEATLASEKFTGCAYSGDAPRAAAR